MNSLSAQFDVQEWRRRGGEIDFEILFRGLGVNVLFVKVVPCGPHIITRSGTSLSKLTGRKQIRAARRWYVHISVGLFSLIGRNMMMEGREEGTQQKQL